MSALFVYGLFVFGCLAGVARPWIGLVIFYVFVVLEPTWNWRWAIDPDFPYQKYIGAAVALGFSLTGFRRSPTVPTVKWGIAGMLMFLAIAYLSALQSISAEYSYRYMDFLWKIVLMAFMTIWLVDSPRKLMTLAWVIVLCSGYNVFQINLQYFQDGYSIYARTGWGVKGDNNVFSIYVIPIMSVAASLCVYAKNNLHRAVAGATFVLQMHTLMLLESRGAMIGGMFTALVFAVFVPKSLRVWILLVAGMVAGSILAGPSVVKEFSSAFQTGDSLDTSASSRFLLWKAGMTLTSENLLLGVGPNAGRFLVPAHIPSETDREQKALHNLFFEISTGCGVPATICYFWYFALTWWMCFRSLRQLKHDAPDWLAASTLAVTCGLPGYMLASMFSSGALLESSYLLAAMGAAAVSIARFAQNEPQNEVVYAEPANLLPSGSPVIGGRSKT